MWQFQDELWVTQCNQTNHNISGGDVIGKEKGYFFFISMQHFFHLSGYYVTLYGFRPLTHPGPPSPELVPSQL